MISLSILCIIYFIFIGDNQTGHLKETKTIFSLFSSFTFTLFIFSYGGLVSFVSLLDKCFNIASASYPQWTKQVNQDRSKSFNSFVVVDFLPNLDASLYFFGWTSVPIWTCACHCVSYPWNQTGHSLIAFWTCWEKIIMETGTRDEQK